MDEQEALDRYRLPPKEWLSPWLKALEPWRRYVSPVFEGTEHIPTTRPLLFVGNHTLWAILDMPLLWAELLEKHGIVLRGLGDHVHFKIPGFRELLWRFGAVDGTMENAERLMAHGQCLLVYPGGAREVTRRRGEKYKLQWKNRLGFARLAIRHGAQIVPFSSVGAEEALDIVYDADDYKKTRLGQLLTKAGFRDNLMFPVVKGIGPTPLPRRERLYFHFSEPVDAGVYAGQDTTENARELKEEVQARVQDGIAILRTRQQRERRRSVWPMWRSP